MEYRRKGEVTLHRLVSLRPRRLTVPVEEATLDLFEVPHHPAGSLKTCRCWTFILLAESYSIFIPLLMCTFWGWDSKKHFVPHAAPVGRIINNLYFVTLFFTMMLSQWIVRLKSFDRHFAAECRVKKADAFGTIDECFFCDLAKIITLTHHGNIPRFVTEKMRLAIFH